MIMQIITTHTNTDFDALASVVAANILFPAAKVVLPQNVNPNVQQFLSLHKDVFSYVTSRDVDIEFVMPGGRNLVIGRSRTESINIGTVMRGIGGGGHSGAGSAMIKLVNPGVVAAWIRILIGESAQEYRYVEDLMSTPAFALDPTTTMQEAFTALRQRGHHGAPVVENGRIVGVLSLP